MIDRQTFAKEMMLREHIRKAIQIVLENKTSKKNQILEEEQKLRRAIRQILSESDPAVSTDAVHSNTGINALEDLFKNSNLLTTLRQGYKSLTSRKEQRESYKNHILTAVDSSLETEASRHIGNVEEEGEVGISEELDITIGDKLEDNPAFIDVEKREPTEEEDVEEFAIVGQDKTGRNRAYTDYKNVEKNIITAFDNLDDPTDRKMFRDYILTNLKLYFERFEEELQADLPAPNIETPMGAELSPGPEEVELDTGEIVEWLSSNVTKN